MDSPYIGAIATFAFGFAPRNWMFCQGQILNISTNTALFSLLGTVYGGNGQQTFGLPDLRGRVAIGQGQGPGLGLYSLGQKSGTENTSLTSNTMPSHTHIATFTGSGGGGGGGSASVTSSLKASALPATQSIPGAGTPAATVLAAPKDSDSGIAVFGYVNDPNPGVTLSGLTVTATGGGGGGITGGTVTNAPTGSGLPFSILSPYLCLNYSIAIYGIFPSRN